MMKTMVPCPVIQFECRDNDIFVVDANPEFYEYFGKDVTYFEDGLLDSLLSYNSKAVVTGLYDMVQKGEPLSVSLQIRRANGIPSWIQLEASRTGEDAGQGSRYLGVIIDISGLMLKHFDMEQSLALYHTALDGTPDIIFEYDRRDDICYTCGSLLDSSIDRDIRIPTTDFLQKISKGQLIHREDIPTAMSFFGGLEKGPFIGRYNTGKTGRRIYVHIKAEGTAVYENGRPVRMIGRIRNIEPEIRMVQKDKKFVIAQINSLKKFLNKAALKLESPQAASQALEQAQNMAEALRESLAELFNRYPHIK